jgi:hypothetical protein
MSILRPHILTLLLGFLAHPPAQASPWITNSPLNFGRFSHTATVLLNGQVLIVGGVATSAANANSVELCDLATGTNRLTGAPITPRRDHTATLLLNGRVLVVGGRNGSGDALTNAEAQRKCARRRGCCRQHPFQCGSVQSTHPDLGDNRCAEG